MVRQYPPATSPGVNSSRRKEVSNITHHGIPHEFNGPILHRLTQVPTSPRHFLVAEEWDPGMDVRYWKLS